MAMEQISDIDIQKCPCSPLIRNEKGMQQNIKPWMIKKLLIAYYGEFIYDHDSHFFCYCG